MRDGKSRGESIRGGWSRVFKIALVLSQINIAWASIIPSAELPYGSDSIRTPDGFQCSNSISPESYFDFGVYHDNKGSNANKGVYARVMIPIYRKRDKIDCSLIYKQALKERELKNSLLNLKGSVFGD